MQRRLLWVILCASVWSAVPSAFAQTTTDAADTAARLNAEGLARYEAGAFHEAIDLFARAQRLQPTEPVLTTNLATAHAALGAELAHAGKSSAAIRQYQQALRYDASHAGARIGLTNVYFERGDYAKAQRMLNAYLRDTPNDTDARKLSGELAYRTGDLARAVREWEVVMRSAPDDTDIAARVEKARRELTVEGTFTRDSNPHFTVRYEEDHLEDVSYHVLRLCGEARREVGRELRHFPSRPVEVLLYTTTQFDAATQRQAHVAGLYDGKIRVRIQPDDIDPAYLRRVIYHEYAHLVVGELTENRCPYWLNEGIAQWMSEDFTDRQRRLLQEELLNGGLPSLASLEVVDLRQSTADMMFRANATVFAAVSYLRDRYSSRYLLDLLQHVGEGVAPEEALRESYRQDYAYLDRAVAQYVQR